MARIEVEVRVEVGSQSLTVRQEAEVHPRMVAKGLQSLAERSARLAAGQYAVERDDNSLSGEPA